MLLVLAQRSPVLLLPPLRMLALLRQARLRRRALLPALPQLLQLLAKLVAAWLLLPLHGLLP